jgi:hypothetical protein
MGHAIHGPLCPPLLELLLPLELLPLELLSPLELLLLLLELPLVACSPESLHPVRKSASKGNKRIPRFFLTITGPFLSGWRICVHGTMQMSLGTIHDFQTSARRTGRLRSGRPVSCLPAKP